MEVLCNTNDDPGAVAERDGHSHGIFESHLFNGGFIKYDVTGVRWHARVALACYQRNIQDLQKFMVNGHLVDHKIGHTSRFALPFNVSSAASYVADIAAGGRNALDAGLAFQLSSYRVKSAHEIALIKKKHIVFVITRFLFADVFQLSTDDDGGYDKYHGAAELHYHKCLTESIVFTDSG